MTNLTTTTTLRALFALFIFALAFAAGCSDFDLARIEAEENHRELESLLLLEEIWVTVDGEFPGVYYDQIEGACPHGGESLVNACLIASIVDTELDYRFDMNAVEPGIYYNFIDGDCSAGGIEVDGACKLAPVMLEFDDEDALTEE